MALKDLFYTSPDPGVPWPKDAKGTPCPAAFLTHLSSIDLEGQIIANLLRQAEIPLQIEKPNNGAFGEIMLGFSGTGISLYVPENMLDEAKAILDAEIIEIAGSEVRGEA